MYVSRAEYSTRNLKKYFSRNKYICRVIYLKIQLNFIEIRQVFKKIVTFV